MQLDHIHVPVSMGLLPLETAPKEKKKKRKYQVQFVLPMHSLEHDQTSSAQSLKED